MKKIILVSIFLISIFSFKNSYADFEFTCDARVSSTDVNISVLETTESDPNLWKIGVMEVGKPYSPELVNFKSSSYVSDNDKFNATYNFSVLEKEAEYYVLIFAKNTGDWEIALPNCNFNTPPLVNGACGSAVGQTFSTQPTENLCSQGESKGVTQNYKEWRWMCYGQNGGNDSPVCIANVGISTTTTTSDSNDIVDASSRGGLLVPDCPEDGCGFDQFMEMVRKIINFLLFVIATPLAALVFVYAGIILLTSGGDPGKLTSAKKMLGNLLIGYVIALAAWLIINTILSSLGYDGTWFLTRY